MMRNELFSTDEVRIGTWINGKPIYRKVYLTKTPQKKGIIEVANISDTDYDEVTNLYGMYHPYWPEGEGAYGTLNASDISGDIHTFIGGMGEIFMTTSWSLQFDKPVKIVVEYTKSTDDALSGDEVLPTEYGNPIGTIISLMGKTAPDGYLVCDGAVYSISDYPKLSSYFTEQFGTANYFGGDGETTFAVPDLRGEFLRGTGTSKLNEGSGADVGVHQEPTIIPNMSDVYHSEGNYLAIIRDSASYIEGKNNFLFRNMDKSFEPLNGKRTLRNISFTSMLEDSNADLSAGVSVRPTNTAVLFCIKYTDGMEGQEGTSTNASNNVYSSEETVIGTYNGKPLYRKLFNTGDVTMSGTWNLLKDMQNAVLNLENLVNVGGSMIISGVDNLIIPVPFNQIKKTKDGGITSNEISIVFDKNISGFNIMGCWESNITVNITFFAEYTKLASE